MEAGSGIRERALKCQDLLKRSESSPSLSRLDWLQNAQGNFNLWCFGLGATTRGKSSLDFTVRRRNDVRDLICDLLDGLDESLEDCLEQAHELDRPDYDKFSAIRLSSIESDSVFSEYESNIKTILKQLTRVHIAIRRYGTQLRYQKADSQFRDAEKHADLCEFKEDMTHVLLTGLEDERTKIAAKTQKSLSSLDVIQLRLINANLVRRHRIKYTTEKTRRLLDQQKKQKDNDEKQARQIRHQILGGQMQEAFEQLDNTRIRAVVPLYQEQSKVDEASTSRPSEQRTAVDLRSDFKFKKLGSKKAATILTSVTKIGSKQDYPSCPNIALLGGLTPCPYCAEPLDIEYKNNLSRWRGHLARDLLPYVCLSTACRTPSEMYATTDDLTKHIKREHGICRWVCDRCSSERDPGQMVVFEDKDDWEAHTLESHVVGLTKAQLNVLSEASLRKMIEPMSCPLCSYSVDSVQPEISDHIAEHLHSFALRSLPWGSGSCDTDSNLSDRNIDGGTGDGSSVGSVDADNLNPLEHVPITSDEEMAHRYYLIMNKVRALVTLHCQPELPAEYSAGLGADEMRFENRLKWEAIRGDLVDKVYGLPASPFPEIPFNLVELYSPLLTKIAETAKQIEASYDSATEVQRIDIYSCLLEYVQTFSELLTKAVEDALVLYRSQLRRDSSQYEHELEIKLMHELGYTEEAIVQAAAYIREADPSISVSDYIDQVQSCKVQTSWITQGETGESYRAYGGSLKAISTTFQISFEQLIRVRPTAANLLSLVSCLPPDRNVPISLLGYLGHGEWSHGPKGHGWFREGVDLEYVPTQCIKDDIAVLRDYTMIVVHDDGESIEIRNVTRALTRRLLELGGDLESVQNLSATVVSRYSRSISSEDSVRERQTQLNDENLVLHTALDVQQGTARLASISGRYQEAEQSYNEVLKRRRQAQGEEHPDTLLCLADLATTYFQSKQYEKAEQLDLRLVATRKRVLGEDHIDTIASISNLASTYWAQRRYGEAEKLEVEAVNRSNRVLGSDHLDTLASVANLASIRWYLDREDYDMTVHQQVLKARERLLGKYDPRTLMSMYNVAHVKIAQEKYDEAKQLLEHVVSARSEMMGTTHADTLEAMTVLYSIQDTRQL